MTEFFWCPSFTGSPTPFELTRHLSASSIVNETTLEVVDSQEIKITEADTTQWQLRGLKEGSLYRFLLSACTRAGCGPPLAQESSTAAQARECETSVSGIIPIVLGMKAPASIEYYRHDIYDVKIKDIYTIINSNVL